MANFITLDTTSVTAQSSIENTGLADKVHYFVNFAMVYVSSSIEPRFQIGGATSGYYVHQSMTYGGWAISGSNSCIVQADADGAADWFLLCHVSNVPSEYHLCISRGMQAGGAGTIASIQNLQGVGVKSSLTISSTKWVNGRSGTWDGEMQTYGNADDVVTTNPDYNLVTDVPTGSEFERTDNYKNYQFDGTNWIERGTAI